MNLTDISNIRLTNLQIPKQDFTGIGEVVNRLGALQAQDFQMSKWAVGCRLHTTSDKAVEEAFNNGEILRTHVLRPTLHLVSRENINWMLELTAPAIKSGLKTRYKDLELTEPLFKKCKKIFLKSLKDENHLTRDEIFIILSKNKIRTDNQRGYHILAEAELDRIICSGRLKGGKQTFALLDERVPLKKVLTKEEALQKIAQIYFSSRGPATLQDFKWWSGLSASDSRKALETVKHALLSEESGSETYWFEKSIQEIRKETHSVHLLPAFDEFLISYKNRSASIQLSDHKKAVSDNGLFRPVIVVNGRVVGIWRRIVKKEKVLIEMEFFKPVSKSVLKELEKKVGSYGFFSGKQAEISQIRM